MQAFDPSLYPFSWYSIQDDRVHTGEIAEILAEATLEVDSFMIYAAWNNVQSKNVQSVIDDLKKSTDSSANQLLAAIQDPNLETIYLELKNRTNKWRLALISAAKKHGWPMLSIGARIPIDDPEHDVGIKLDPIVLWLRGMGNARLANVLESMKRVTLARAKKSSSEIRKNEGARRTKETKPEKFPAMTIDLSQHEASLGKSSFDRLADDAMIRERDLVASSKRPGEPSVLPFSSSTLWRKVGQNEFPQPVRLGPRVTAWQVGEVRAWLNKQRTS